MLPELAARVCYNCACRAIGRDDFHAAARALHASLACAPASAPTWMQLGSVYTSENQLDLALGCYRRAAALAPDSPLPLINVADALLKLGQWAEGWTLYEHRYASPGFRAMNGLAGGDAAKMWRGESLVGKTLLLFAEQGAGDTLMMLRFVSSAWYPSAAEAVILRLPAPLLRLARSSFGAAPRLTIISDSERLPLHDYLAPLMSLPARFDVTTPDDVRDSPYLATRGEQLAGAPGMRVGIVWAGSAGFANDCRRSIPLELVAPLFDTPGTTWVSLQRGPRATEIAAYPKVRTVPVHDYYDTAAVMQSLDLVISCDSSPAHLAGALGVPVWTLLAYSPDFRWMLDTETTPWYDSMRLFRQRTRGYWPGVIARVRRELAMLGVSGNAA